MTSFEAKEAAIVVEAARSGVVTDNRWPWSIDNGEGGGVGVTSDQARRPLLLGVC